MNINYTNNGFFCLLKNGGGTLTTQTSSLDNQTEGLDNQSEALCNQNKVLCIYKRINGVEEIVFVKNGNIYGVTKVKLCAAKSENKAGTS